jgi:Na+/proline symporter
MSDVGLYFSPLDLVVIALIIGAPGLIVGAVLGALLWRRHRFYGAVLGGVVGLVVFDAGVMAWKASPWG